MVSHFWPLAMHCTALQIDSPWSSHGVIQDRTHGHTHDTDALRRIRPLWCPCHNHIQHVQHVPPVADLLRPRRVIPVGVLARDLLEHLVEVHVDASVVLNQLPKLLKRWSQLLGRVCLGVGGGTLDVAVVDAVVGRKPCARS